MTREEAIQKAINIVIYFEAHFAKSKEAREDAANIIEALEQEPCEDAVSRQAVQDYIAKYLSQYLYYDVREVVEAIDEYIGELPSVNPQKIGWIPVSERLPEDNELVLFSTKTDRVFEGRFFSDNTDRQWYSFCDRTFAWNNVVIAWMPLPEPYKAESEDKE